MSRRVLEHVQLPCGDDVLVVEETIFWFWKEVTAWRYGPDLDWRNPKTGKKCSVSMWFWLCDCHSGQKALKRFQEKPE